MLKSLEFIEKLSEGLEKLVLKDKIHKYFLNLSLNQTVNIIIISDVVKDESALFHLLHNVDVESDFDKLSLSFEWLTKRDFESDEYDYLQSSNKINYGMRRSLGNLMSTEKPNNIISCKCPIVTFFSYKGGVGRTTSLAMFASYYANKGNKVFVIDCDFEAPGLVNFFNISQFNNPKNGVVEYINDKKFVNDLKLNDEYVYEVPASYNNIGKINLMPAGNVFGEDKSHYLEGLSRIDIHGTTLFKDEFHNLIKDIEEEYNPDVILIDSRTGFNNVFGTLAQLSSNVVALFGDDNQNDPGIEFLLERFTQKEYLANICFILSIISTKVSKRIEKFKGKISSFVDDYYEDESEDESEDIVTYPTYPSFCFQRTSILELVGTEYEDHDDFNMFINEDTPSGYKLFFEYLETDLQRFHSENECVVDEIIKLDNKANNEVNRKVDLAETVIDKQTNIVSLEDNILNKLQANFPEPYAESENFDDTFLSTKFYVRQCMQDLLIPEYNMLLGIKGSGKTAFYKALQSPVFFNALVRRAEKSHLNYDIMNIISEQGNINNEHYFSLSSHFNDEMIDEAFTRKIWVIYIWNRVLVKLKDYNSIIDFRFVITNSGITAEHFRSIIEDKEKYLLVEMELLEIDKYLKKNDKRLLITFDELDFVVIPSEWDKGISPLIRLCQNVEWERIQPKLFIRRDLFAKLGNFTNKNILEKSVINLEWKPDEMYAFFFKVILANAKSDFIDFLKSKLPTEFVKKQVELKINSTKQFNQLQTDSHTLRRIVNVFFGETVFDHGDSYDTLYRNLRNADGTISLRPFLDLIKYAIEAQIQDSDKLRGGAVLGAPYCFYGNVRAKAVHRYFTDLSTEVGNELIKAFVEDMKNNLIPHKFKYSSLSQHEFDELVEEVKANHQELITLPAAKFEEMLTLNGILFVSYMSGSRKKYSFAYLYKHYMGLKSPSSKSRRK